jgi:pyruvate ferredoxin oxidoreductase delta subunit
LKWPVKNIEEITWRDLELGGAITEPGSSRFYKTGDWKSFKPVVDKNKCIKCGLCYIFCPDAAIYEDNEGFFVANLDYCKGCGICASECYVQCIKMVEEEA